MPSQPGTHVDSTPRRESRSSRDVPASPGPEERQQELPTFLGDVRQGTGRETDQGPGAAAPTSDSAADQISSPTKATACAAWEISLMTC